MGYIKYRSPDGLCICGKKVTKVAVFPQNHFFEGYGEIKVEMCEDCWSRLPQANRFLKGWDGEKIVYHEYTMEGP